MIKVEFVSVMGNTLEVRHINDIPRVGDSVALFDRNGYRSVGGKVTGVLWKMRPTGIEVDRQTVEIGLKDVVLGEGERR